MSYLERSKTINAVGTVINPATEETANSINQKLPDLVNNQIPVSPSNITTKFRDAFEGYTANTTWNEVKGTGDLIYVDGNSASASYLVISKNPLAMNTESSVTTSSTFNMPIELACGISMSQRTVGQEFAIEIVDTQSPLPDVPEILISSVTQTTTTLTVNTTTSHGLSVGKSIGIKGCLDSRINYPAVVVASVPAPNQFTATAGPAGAIPSLSSFIGSALAATTAALPTATYSNGTLGVGATLTATTNGAFPNQDGIPITLNARVLVKNQSAGAENGLYVLTTVGTAGTPWVLTRATEFDTTAEMTVVAGVSFAVSVFVEQGSTQAQKEFYLSATVTTVGTTAVTFVDAGSSGPLGYVYFRERLGRAQNGLSQIFENATATQASLYIRSASGDALPSATIAGAHAVTVGTTAPIQLINSPYQYAFSATTEYRMFVQADRTQWADSSVDSVTQTTNRLLRTQVCPDLSVSYKLRIRAVNNKSLTIPNAQIVSAVKTGTTTATITTDVAHGLLTGDLVVVYGIRDQAAASFPNLTTATAITVTSSTQFTVVIGTASTVTSYGGFVARVNGGNLPSALGAIAQVIQSATLTTLVDGTRQLTLVGSAAWAGVVIGDLVNVVGCRDISTGATLSLDGAWKVANLVTTALTLVLPYTGSMGIPADFTTTSCGGAVIKRTEMRISFARVFDYGRERVELLARPAADISSAVPVAIQGGTLPAVTTVSTVSTVSIVTAVTAANLNFPQTIADNASVAVTSSANTAAITPTFGISYQVNIPVTAVSGTSPTLDITIEESDDGGTNWYKVYDFPRISAVGIYRTPLIPLIGNRVRYLQVVGGSSPSFTRAINRLQSSQPAAPIRQLIDRTININSLNSVTANLASQDCGNRVQLVVNVGAITTTAPVFQLEGSDDANTSWYSIGSPLTAVASNTVQLTINDINSQFVRARVSTAGSGATAGYVMIKAHD